jgi:hypothetical protein
MSDLPELSVEHVNLAGVLMNVASQTGVFKLPQFSQVSFAFNECRRVVEESQKKEDPLKIEDVPKNNLVLVHNVLEYAANNNGFRIGDYDAVVKVVAIFGAYLKPYVEELKKKEEEEKKGEEEEKKGEEEEKKGDVEEGVEESKSA